MGRVEPRALTVAISSRHSGAVRSAQASGLGGSNRMKRRKFRAKAYWGPHGKPANFKKAKPGLILFVEVLGRPQIEFVRHALDQMNRRRISRDQVIDAINDPTRTGLPTERGRERVRREFPGSGKVIDVVYQEMADRIRVITAFPRPRL
jgi:Domain of unknown function (DUF4258)